ncbi:helix-turn-helix domain-containing protein [Gorillibacterium timonense]|uniref:helix-turn-helix domain-containing protein n=1 Tax=Gorillibacterium timonense TaxID=1689269 RepID=UPI00071D34EF|nr:AraC family transcriptional regulator [Gorillibacterium timonense]
MSPKSPKPQWQSPFDPSELTIQLHDAELKRVGRDEQDLYTQQLLIHPTILVLLEGACHLRRANRVSPMKPDTVYVCKPGSTISLSAEQEPASVAILRIAMYKASPEANGHLKPLTAGEPFPLPEEASLVTPGKPSDRCRTICSLSGCNDPLLRCRAQIETMELLLDVAAGHGKSRHAAPDAIECVRQYIDEHVDEPLTTEKLSEMAGFSTKRFTELFKKRFGVSAHDYMTRSRLNRAVRLMLRPGRRLKDVAHAVGYEDEFYFSRLFKKEYGISPSQYIAERKHRVSAYACASGLGYLLALDIIPQAAPIHPKWTGYYLERYGSDIPHHLDYGRAESPDDASFAHLADSQPRLIVCPAETSCWEREKLEAVAPIALLPKEEPDSWKTGLRRLAERLELQPKADRWIRQFEERTLLASRRIQAAGGGIAPSVLFARMTNEGLFSLGSAGTLDYVYRSLGLRRPAVAPSDSDPSARVWMKQLTAADVDFILILVRQDSSTLEQWRKLRQTAEWQAIPAVRRNRVRLISSSPWREYSPVALDRIRENLVELLGRPVIAESVDTRPAVEAWRC